MSKIKILFLSLAFALISTTYAQDVSNAEGIAPQTNQQIKSPHNLSIDYGIITVSDLAFAISQLFSFDKEKKDFLFGSLSINYGYQVNDFFETGIVANIAAPNYDLFLFTLMPRAKINFNSDGFVNPFIELDLGASMNLNGICPMFHLTLFGLEIGHFYMQLLGWGQRGAIYFGVKF